MRLIFADVFQETLKELFPSWEAVHKHREVVIFTSGLMKDPRPLVEHLYEAWIDEVYVSEMRDSNHHFPDLSSTDAYLFKSIFTESQLPDHPLHNKFINYYDHHKDDRMKRPHDTKKIYFPSRVYHFNHMREVVVMENHLSAAAQTPNCAMVIYNDPFWPPEAVTRDVLLVCSEIFKQQPVTHLCMVGVDCHNLSLTAQRMINPQYLCLCECDLPDQFVRSLIQDLFGAGDSLQKLVLDGINLRPFESLLDELIENLVVHHVTHKGQRKLGLWLFGTRLSEDFKEKWRKGCRGVESIDCKIVFINPFPAVNKYIC